MPQAELSGLCMDPSLTPKKIEFFLSCQDVVGPEEKPYDCFAVLMQRRGTGVDFQELERTETICNSSSPQFCTSFELKYHEEEQNTISLRVDIYERMTVHTEKLREHEHRGTTSFSLQSILEIPHNQLCKQLYHPINERKVGMLFMNAEDIDVSNKENDVDIEIEVSASILRKRDWNKTVLSQRYELSRAHRYEDDEGQTVWMPVYRSDRIGRQRDSNTLIEFSNASIKYRHLCNGDEERQMRISIYGTCQTSKQVGSKKSELLIGSTVFTLRFVCEIDPTEEVLGLERAGDADDIGYITILRAEPTDYGSHFSFQINHENTFKYTSSNSEGKNGGVRKKRRRKFARRISVSSVARASRKISAIASNVDGLFSNSFNSNESLPENVLDNSL